MDKHLKGSTGARNQNISFIRDRELKAGLSERGSCEEVRDP